MRLAEAGAAVAVNYHRPARTEFGRDNVADAAEVVGTIEAAGGRATAVEADVADKAAVERMVGKTVSGFLGRAGHPGQRRRHLPLPRVLGHAGGALAAGPGRQPDRPLPLLPGGGQPGMVKQGRGGRIISISSISAYVGGALQTHYTPTKAGVHSLMTSLAIVLGPHGITCNSVMPGAVATDINKEDLSDPAKREYFEKRIPVGRLGTPDDIAGPVVFLASDAARYVNGASVLTDGGLLVNLQ